jgi:hypothetical protein
MYTLKEKERVTSALEIGRSKIMSVDWDCVVYLLDSRWFKHWCEYVEVTPALDATGYFVLDLQEVLRDGVRTTLTGAAGVVSSKSFRPDVLDFSSLVTVISNCGRTIVTTLQYFTIDRVFMY